MALNYVHVCLDLGGDSLKIAFSYKQNSNVKFGKIVNPSRFTQIAVPALAYYDVQNRIWYYGDQIVDDGDSFVTVVKIKNLLSLISNNANSTVKDNNINYYVNGNKFPKFYFPARREMLDNFENMVKNDMVFEAKNYTPKAVCQAFFNYVKELVLLRIASLQATIGVSFDGVKVSIVHPSSMGGDYIAELSALIKNAFGAKPNKVLSTNKALAIYALQRGAVKSGDEFLVFDFGEEEISVVRAGCKDDQVYIEGADGHNPPLKVGGIDVDKAIVSSLEKDIYERETLGTPKAGEQGHIYEDSVYSKQYQLMKDVKRAKVILSRDFGAKSYLNESFPISISRDVIIQRNFSKNDLKDCVGTSKDDGVAKAIVNYVIEELARPVNHDIKKVFISGGLIETYSLKDYINQKLSNSFKNVKLLTFDDNVSSGKDYDILSFEDSVYAPAVGGSIVSLKNIEIKMIAPLSFGVFVFANDEYGKRVRVLDLFLDRGTEIKEGDRFTTPITLRNVGVPSNEELFSTHVTKQDIIDNRYKGKWSYTPDGYIKVGDPGSYQRQKTMKDIGLRTVTGGKNGKIYFKYNSRKVNLYSLNENYREYKKNYLDAVEGVIIGKDGSATPFIENVSTSRTVDVYDANLSSVMTSDMKHPSANKIQICVEGLDCIIVSEK